MSTLQVRGHGRGGIARELYKRSKVKDDVKVLPDVFMEANLVFDKVKVAYDKENNMRPYFSFLDGRIISVIIPGVRDFAPELGVDNINATFDPGSSPDVTCRWDLSNAEIADLVPKCLFGSDYGVDHEGEDCPYPKPRFGDCMEMAEEFTSSVWEGIPIKSTVRILVDFQDGKPVPVISIEPELENNEIRTNSRVSGFQDIARFIPEKSYQQSGLTEDFQDIFDVETFGRSEKASAEPRPLVKPEEKFVPMTPSEKREAAIVAGLSGDVSAGVAARQTGDDIEYAVRDEEKAGSRVDESASGSRYDVSDSGEEIMLDPYEAKAIQRGEAFGEDELEAFNLIDRKKEKPADSYVYDNNKNKKNSVLSAVAAADDLRRRQAEEGLGLE